MLNKEPAKEKLKNLVKDFKDNLDYYRKLSEADVEDKLVSELFVNILGWDKKDYEKRAKVRRGDKGGSADYAFKINDRIVFFLEVKKVIVPLEKEADEQVILYALSKKVPLAISTNFEQMNIFCVEQENAIKNVFRTFKTPEDYVNNFSDLWFLSKESFEQGLLLKKAEDEGRLKKRVSIDKILLEDFWRVRTLIANDIEKNKPGKYNINEKDEIVQRILDRLIFVRKCEDSCINPENLTLEEIKHVAENKAYSQLKILFSKYDSTYNSGLFTPNKDNDCDIITINGEIIQQLINYLYESHDGKYKYHFEWIDADVLGQVYEQYLGKIMRQTKSGKAKLKEGQAHRKEQGIYYTPTYIVDYIVKNTLGELLKDKKVDARKIKILDPACGSGSFLIKAFDYLNEHLSKSEEAKQYKLDGQGLYSVKTEILKNNIFGVDLDNKAVEITKLNLLLKAAEKFRKLPSELDLHIKHGNSLIDDETIAPGSSFNWVGDFQEGTFDVVIGNPPYVRPENVDKNEREYYLNSNKYNKFFGRFDVYILFIERALKLLKTGGYFSFIIPNSFLNQNYSKILREWILKEFKIINIVDLSQVKVFEAAEVNTCILVIQKLNPKKDYYLKILKPTSLLTLNNSQVISLKQDIFMATPQFMIRTDLNDKKIKIIGKIIKDTNMVSEMGYIVIGSVPHDSKTGASKDRLIFSSKSGESFKKYIEGKDMSRYYLSWRGIYLNYQPKIMHRPKFPELFENDKLIIRNISTKEGLLAVYDETKYYTNDTVSLFVPWFKLKDVNIKGENITPLMIENSKKYNLKYCLGLINSKTINFYFKHILSSNLHVYPEAIRNLPIKIIPESQQQPIIKLVDRMLSLNKQLQEMGDKKTAQTAKLEEEIKKTDQEIDDLVYKLYDITEEEKKIIEESVTK